MNTTQTRFGIKQIAIVLLTVATAGIHLERAISAFRVGDMTTTIMFTLSSLGYLALLAAYYLPIRFAQERHNLVRWAFIALTAVAIIAWVAIGERSTLAYVDKLIEVTLLILLLTDKSRS
jgi:hypothetical protein